MAVTREVFESGITPEQFIDQMDVNKDKFLENIEAAEISDLDKEFFKNHPVKVAAIAEDWCTDVVQFLPVMIKLARNVDEVELSIFLRDSTNLINDYLKQGEFKSIPVFVFLDGDWNELGHFIERPDEVTKLMAEETQRFAKANPDLEGANRSYANMPDETREKVRANSSRFRWDSMQEWNRIFIDDIKSLVESGQVATAR